MANVQDQIDALAFEIPTALTFTDVVAAVRGALPADGSGGVRVTREEENLVLLEVRPAGGARVGKVSVQLFGPPEGRRVRFHVPNFTTANGAATGYGQFATLSREIYVRLTSPAAGGATPVPGPSAIPAATAPPVVPGPVAAPSFAVDAPVSAGQSVPSPATPPPVGSAASAAASPPVPAGAPQGQHMFQGKAAPSGMVWSGGNPSQRAGGVVLLVVGCGMVFAAMIWGAVGYYIDQSIYLLLLVGGGIGLAWIGKKVVDGGNPQLVPESQAGAYVPGAASSLITPPAVASAPSPAGQAAGPSGSSRPATPSTPDPRSAPGAGEVPAGASSAVAAPAPMAASPQQEQSVYDLGAAAQGLLGSADRLTKGAQENAARWAASGKAALSDGVARFSHTSVGSALGIGQGGAGASQGGAGAPQNHPAAQPTLATAAPSSADLAIVTNPAADPAELHRIAAESPSLRPLIALHAAAYPGLLEWLGSLGDPAVDAALAARRGKEYEP